MPKSISQSLLLILCGSVLVLNGCAEGMFWRTGYLSPWVRQKWQEEETIATTLFSKKDRLTALVESAQTGTVQQQDQVASELQDIVFRSPVVLLRLHAVDLLGKLNSPTAIQSLEKATQDRNTEIRIAAVKSLGLSQSEEAARILQEVIGSDTNDDVRLNAVKSLAQFPSPQSVSALALALEDSNPALQVASTEALSELTGQQLGADVYAWKSYLRQLMPSDERVANQPSDTKLIR